MAIFYALLSAVLFGTADFTGGFASRSNPVPAVLVWSQLAGLGLVIAFALLDGGLPQLAPRDLWLGAATGLAGVGGLGFLYRGLARGYVSIVSPLAAIVGAVVPILAGLILGEEIPATATAGIATGVVAIGLISRSPDDAGQHDSARRRRESWQDGILSGLLFGWFFILISRTSAGSGMWPLAVARLASIALVALGTRLGGRSLALRARAGTVVLAGLLDMAANIAFVLAVRQGLLTIVSVISSAYPAQTVILSRLILGERIGWLRGLGIAGALVAIALMSL